MYPKVGQVEETKEGRKEQKKDGNEIHYKNKK
jgi:hypothetical protein